jgi:hypothetical protein
MGGPRNSASCADDSELLSLRVGTKNRLNHSLYPGFDRWWENARLAPTCSDKAIDNYLETPDTVGCKLGFPSANSNSIFIELPKLQGQEHESELRGYDITTA